MELMGLDGEFATSFTNCFIKRERTFLRNLQDLNESSEVMMDT